MYCIAALTSAPIALSGNFIYKLKRLTLSDSGFVFVLTRVERTQVDEFASNSNTVDSRRSGKQGEVKVGVIASV